MPFFRSNIMFLAAGVAGIALLAWAAGRSAAPPPTTFSFDQWDQERRARAPLIERTKVAMSDDFGTDRNLPAR